MPEAVYLPPHSIITPADSDSEEAAHFKGQHHQPRAAFAQQWSPQDDAREQPPSFPSVTEPVDMDMDVTMEIAEPIPLPLPLVSGSHLEPGPSQPDPIATTITGRMPTPIQPSFAAQVRGNNWGGAAGNIMHSGVHPVPYHSRSRLSSILSLDWAVEGTYENASMFADEAIPRTTLDPVAMNDWSVVQNRSLLSPISESGGEDMASPTMVLDGIQLRSNSVDNSHSLPPRSHSAMSLPPIPSDGHTDDGPWPDGTGGGNGGSTLAARNGAVSSLTAMDTDLPATPSPKKGHTRSRHTFNSWTLQPGMKKSFSIGYRADCEKCRNKVPGHFNHIIVS